VRSDGILKHAAIAFVIAVVFYVVGFEWIEHRRTFRGPWQVDFRADTNGAPSLLISQTNLNISETMTFPGQTVRPGNFSRAINFNEATTNLPFGDMLFQDPTFLPGTVTMRLFGHEVELLPRVLIVDKKEYPWKAGGIVQVQ
jgi:hypothetical protein